MPKNMVVTMQAQFMSCFLDHLEPVRKGGADRPTGEKRPRESGFESVDGERSGPAHLCEEPLVPEDSEQSPAGVVGAEGDEKRGREVSPPQDIKECHDPILQAGMGVNVDLEGESGRLGQTRTVSLLVTSFRNHEMVLRRPSSSSMRGVTPRMFFIRSILGMRRGMSS